MIHDRAERLGTDAQVRQGAPTGPAGITQEQVQQAMGADVLGSVLSGQSADEFTKDPGMLRNISFGIGSLLQKLGLPTTTTIEATTPMGLRPAFVPALLADQFIRRQVTGGSPTNARPAQGANPLAGQAGKRASDVIKLRQMKPVIGLDARGMRASEYFGRQRAQGAAPPMPTGNVPAAAGQAAAMKAALAGKGHSAFMPRTIAATHRPDVDRDEMVRILAQAFKGGYTPRRER